MNVFVIGGAGYIGSHVVKALLKDGCSVTVYDNLSSGLEQNLFKNAKFVKGDILDYEKLLEASKGYDAIIHLAAFKAAGESMIKPEKYSVNNITGTLNILNAASVNEIKRIVFSSSAATYGEPSYLPIDEDHPKNPENYYGFTKLEIERFLAWYDQLKGIRFAALRYFNAAGYDPEGEITGLEQNPANLLPVIMEVAAGMRSELGIFGDDYDTVDGTGVRDYVHVTDLADAHVKALHYIDDKDESLTVNLGSENGLSVKQIVDAARDITGQTITANIMPRRPGDPAKLVASSKKANELLKWKANFSDVETLVKSSWNAYLANKK
ncbi:MAG: UDP-glucose 4-epimerase GalE [Spirochaetales bacterium]|nr:UDP-glucose 4-epimerase GalE [Spirochaetales bacterium]